MNITEISELIENHGIGGTIFSCYRIYIHYGKKPVVWININKVV